MPGKLPRYKVIHCKTCGKVIHTFDRKRYHGHVPKEKILEAVRHHYKRHHPAKWAKIVKKSSRSRS